MSDTIRTFIAIKLPEKILPSVKQIRNGFKSQGIRAKWVKVENIHITIKFLGDIKITDVGKIIRSITLAAKKSKPITLSVKGAGVFPRVKRPRVIWAGITGEVSALFDLQNRVEENLEAIGFPKEPRPFKGHLTIGRIKGETDAKKLVNAMEQFKGFESESFMADHIFLIKSELKQSGAVYTDLSSAFLKDQIDA